MKKQIFKILCTLFIALTITSCSSEDNATNTKDEILLKEHNSVKMGWGKGRETYEAYLSLSVGQGNIQLHKQVADSDEATQNLIDIVFPGNWGSSGGGLTISAPNADGAGTAAYEYCKDWLRKKGTKLVDLPVSFDIAAFDKIKTVSQIKALENEHGKHYSNWDLASAPKGKTYLVRTFEGYLALIFIQDVQGTYGDTQANVTLRIKLTEDKY